MSAPHYMGPREVQKLILGQWVSIVGKHHHDHDHDHDRDDDDNRGQYGRDQQQPYQQPWQQQPQPWQQPWQQQQYQQPWQQQQYPYPQQPYQQPYQQRSPGYHPHPGQVRRATVSVHPRGGQNQFGGLERGIASILGEPNGYQIPPRNALVQDPAPERAGREVLPMSTGVAILPTQSAQITARPQRVAFRPERVFISAAGTSGGAADWVVNDIKIGNRSQFSQSGDVPGDMFATNAIDGFVSFETAQTAMDVVMVVTYIGLNESGVPFFASIVGTAAI